MELPPIHLPLSPSAVIGVVALIHITLVTMVITGPLVAVVTEYLGLRKNDAKYDPLAKRLVQILIEVTVIGGIFGSAMVVLFLGLFPVLITTMFNVFFWFLVLQLLAGYLVNLLFMSLYYLRWERMKDRRGAHMALGIVAGIAPLIVAIVFNAAVTFMGTPGSWPETGNVWHGVFNPTFWPSLFHRIVASLALVGVLIVAQALWRRKRSASEEETAFEVRYGARLAIHATAAQLIPGVWYYFALPSATRQMLWIDYHLPWMLGILAAIVAVVLFATSGYRVERQVVPGRLWAGVVLLVATVWLMGWTRSATRGQDLIAGVMNSEQELVQVPPSLVPAVSGETIFAQECGMCHPGLAGDAVQKAKKYETDEDLKAFLRDPGSRGVPMPPTALEQRDLDALVRYLREQAGGSKDSTASRGDTLSTASLGEYVAFAWNDLGMHCYDEDESVFCILPPYQTIWVQVVKRGDPPSVVTQGLRVRYSYQNNRTSAEKTNFWQHAEKLFGARLEQDVGLKGFSLSGEMEAAGDHFVAEGIPLTAYLDDGTFEPFQTANIEVVREDEVVFRTVAISPVSPEINCGWCHAPREGASEVEVREAILRGHDEKHGTQLLRDKPVLCGSCHATNALGTQGDPKAGSLSEVLHRAHAPHMDSIRDRTDISCYACHPGPRTRCLRGVMGQQGILCADCHGDEAEVAASIARGREPWFNEPACENCHGENLTRAVTKTLRERRYSSGFADLYRNRVGHGGLRCPACHGSPHAITPAGHEKYNQAAIRLQGKPGPIEKCDVCHTRKPEGAFHHFPTQG